MNKKADDINILSAKTCEKKKKNRPWQLSWWKEEPERWRWAATLAAIALLVGGYAYADEGLRSTFFGTDQVVAEKGGADEPEHNLASNDENDENNDADEQEDQDEENIDGAGTAPNTDANGQKDNDDEVSSVISPSSVNFLYPTTGDIFKGFGFSYDLTHGDYRFHSGCDIKAAVGTPVTAVADGVVLSSLVDPIWGGITVIEHFQGCTSIYKCIEPSVDAGAKVFAGDTIGHVLESANAEALDGSHLHFELHVNEEEVNPEEWLTQ